MGVNPRGIYDLVINVKFTEEEKAQINKLGLTKDYDKNTLVTGIAGSTMREICISWLVRDGGVLVPSLPDLGYAKKIEATTLSALKDLKEHISYASDTGAKTVEF